MPHTLRSVTLAFALLGSGGLAFADGDRTPGSSTIAQVQGETTGQASGSMSKGGAAKGKLSLSSSEKQSIAQGLAAEPVAPDPGFRASPGARVPASVGLKPVPVEVSNKIPSVRLYSYAKLQNNEIVLADPKDRTVEAVIEGASTTGSGAATPGR